MRRAQRAARSISVPLSVALSVFVVIVLWGPGGLGAGGLKDTVKNLYGGDGILLAPPPPGGFDHAPHFLASSLQGLDSLNSALASSLGLFAFNSTVSGFTFDIERGVPVRTTESLGPLLAERAPTLGAGKLNIAFSYTRLDFDRFEGDRLDELSLTFIHEDVTGDGKLGPPPFFAEFELDQIRVDLDLEIEEDVFALFATYGLTQRWDVGVVVPIVHVRLRAVADATLVDNSPNIDVHFFDPAQGSDPTRSTGGGDETGIGDVLLRSKYNFLRKHPRLPDLAILGQVKLPTGDEEDLLGTGETNFQGLLVASRTFGPLTPHANFGYEVSTGGSEENNIRYIAGFDAGLAPKVTVALDILGRWEPEGDGIGDHTVDLALGGKWNVARSFLVNANLQVPLNKDEGLRADVAWTVGVEYTF